MNAAAHKYLPDEYAMTSFLEKLAYESAQEILPYFGSHSLNIQIKQDDSPVTIADQKAELCLRQRIQEEFPDHGIVGEEYGEENSEADFVWYLDPIDGTKSFASGCPLFGTLICLTYQGEPIWGVIHQPVQRQLLIGNNEYTLCNGHKTKVNEAKSLEEATLLTTDTLNIKPHQAIQGWDNLTQKVKTLRTWGDCFGYLLVASGWADIMVDPIMNRWDSYALIPIIRGAGGVITDWQGNDPVLGNSIVAASTSLHAKVIEILNS